MYCVIQKIENKKADIYGTRKNIIADESSWIIDGTPGRSYYYHYSEERFERPIKAAYKISIHKSYRENGKVKKKQWALFTMGYYSILDSSPYDYINDKRVEDYIVDMDITDSEFWDMIYEKIDPLREIIKKEFEQTGEYKAKQDQDRITTIHIATKSTFEEKYGKNTYDYCYDVFGVLRNEDYLKELEESYKSQKEYESNTNSNYNSKSSYQEIKQSNHNDNDKENLRKFYKTLAMKFHPDVCNDDGEAMKLINQLKGEWGL